MKRQDVVETGITQKYCLALLQHYSSTQCKGIIVAFYYINKMELN